MEKYKEIIKSFIDRWGKKDNISAEEFDSSIIAEIEAKQGFHFPMSYKYMISTYSNFSFPEILDYISDNELELFDLNFFISPKDIEKTMNDYISAGMQSGYIGFASDCMGNMFCFKLEELKNKDNDSNVYIFDHDYLEINQISTSFADWINHYNEI